MLTLEQGDRAKDLPKRTQAWHIQPQSDITVAQSISCSSQGSPPAWDGALL